MALRISYCHLWVILLWTYCGHTPGSLIIGREFRTGIKKSNQPKKNWAVFFFWLVGIFNVSPDKMLSFSNFSSASVGNVCCEKLTKPWDLTCLSMTHQVWDKTKVKSLGCQECPEMTFIEWSPCGQYLLTATCSPRLRVNNGSVCSLLTSLKHLLGLNKENYFFQIIGNYNYLLAIYYYSNYYNYFYKLLELRKVSKFIVRTLISWVQL